MQMGEAFRIVVMLLAGGVLLVLLVAGGLLGGALALLHEEKARRKQLQRMEDSHVVKGTFTDQRMTGGVPTDDAAENSQLRHYAFAVSYDDAEEHRCALIGITTEQVLPFKIGDSVELRIASAPLLTPESVTDDPLRGAEGRLPAKISFRRWMGRSVDERGRLMLEMDYQAMKEESLRRFERLRAGGYALLSASVISLILGITWLRSFFTI